MTKRIRSFHLKDDYADSVSLWRFSTLVIFFVFVCVLGVAYVHLRFKVRDLKIAINATETRIEKLREREKAVEAAIQGRAYEWTLKQTAVQRLGMTDFNPSQIIHLEYPDALLRQYTEATSRYQMNTPLRDEMDPIRQMLNRFAPAAADSGSDAPDTAQAGDSRSQSQRSLARVWQSR